MSLFSCRGISKSFGGARILADISLDLQAEEFVSLAGASGAGKTTLFNILAGVETPDCGEVFLNGVPVTGRAGAVSYMPQKDLLFEHLTVLDNITLPLVIHKQKRREAREYALSFFERFGLDGYAKKYPAQLSGGMRQRAALLRAFMLKKPVLLLDEPFSALDQVTRAGIREWYAEISRALRLTTFCVTHDIDEAVLLSRRVYVIKGRPARLCYTGEKAAGAAAAGLKQEILAALEAL